MGLTLGLLEAAVVAMIEPSSVEARDDIVDKAALLVYSLQVLCSCTGVTLCMHTYVASGSKDPAGWAFTNCGSVQHRQQVCQALASPRHESCIYTKTQKNNEHPLVFG